jgi:hypothetical protein
VKAAGLLVTQAIGTPAAASASSAGTTPVDHRALAIHRRVVAAEGLHRRIHLGVLRRTGLDQAAPHQVEHALADEGPDRLDGMGRTPSSTIIR